MSRKSLRKLKKENSKVIPKLETNNLHLIGGKVDHNITHSHSPVSATELEKLAQINPEFPNRLIKIIEDSINNDKLETEQYYKAVEREQQNDELAIKIKYKDNIMSLVIASFIIVSLMIVGCFLIYFEHEWIGGGVLTTVLLGIIRAIFRRKTGKKDEEE